MMKKSLLLCAAALAIGNASVQAQAGAGWNPAGLQLTRAELQEMLSRYEQMAGEGAESDDRRRQARAEADMIRERLQNGDLRAGDRIVLIVEGFAEISDTFSVAANRSIVLPEIGAIPLEGVLRSELQPHLATHIGRFINNPVVHARSLLRLAILGAVQSPGFYAVPPDVLIGEALMLAGGPLPTAQLDGITIQRGDEEIWSRELMREAVVEGRTLDQLNIRAGDGIHVPQAGNGLAMLRNGVLILTGVASLITLAVQLGVF